MITDVFYKRYRGFRSLSHEASVDPSHLRDVASGCQTNLIDKSVGVGSVVIAAVNEASDVEQRLILLREPALRKKEGDRAAAMLC